MDRRQFLLASLGSAGLLGASGLLERNSAYADILNAATATVYTRRNVYCMNDKSPEIAAYKAAITAMRALPASNGVSWMAQANIHGATGAAPPGMIANACQHNPQFFMSWHRMYVHFFERIVRKQSGDPNFALPYWGYSPTGSRDLPAMFRTGGAANPLFDSTRNASINAGTPITASLVDAGLALGKPDFTGFTNSVNGTPHGVVHGAVGGNMGSFGTAGRDPIFWLHHCNIDRLWELWLAAGGTHVNPTDTAWLSTPFNFYDETGATVTLTGAQVVDIACQLHYQYESDRCGRIFVFDPRWRERYTRIPQLPPGLLARLDSLVRRPPLPQPMPIAQAQAPVRLGGRPIQVAVPISAEGKRGLSNLGRDARSGGRINLVLEDVRVEGRPRVAYEVYVNLGAEARDTVYTGPNFVGHVSLFGPGPNDAHKPEPQFIDLTEAYVRLRSANAWPDDTVRVTFVPRGLTDGEDPARVLGAGNQATIGRLRLQIQ